MIDHDKVIDPQGQNQPQLFQTSFLTPSKKMNEYTSLGFDAERDVMYFSEYSPKIAKTKQAGGTLKKKRKRIRLGSPVVPLYDIRRALYSRMELSGKPYSAFVFWLLEKNSDRIVDLVYDIEEEMERRDD